MQSPVTFQVGCAVDAHMFYLACSMDAIAETDYESFSRMSFYQGQNKKKWFVHDLPNWRVVSTCLIPETDKAPRTVVALSEEGDIELYNRNGSTVEKIKDAGVGGESKGFGYVSRIRLIDNTLYVCGLSGQIYARTATGWEHADNEILQPVPSDPLSVDQFVAENIQLTDIAGTNANDLLVVGSDGYIAKFDGVSWVKVVSPVDENLNCIYRQSGDEIWICGFNGALLRGNPRDGFQDVSGINDNSYFQSVCAHGDSIFIGASDGLYVYANNRLERLAISDELNLGEVSHVEATGETLWVVGEKFLATFDGRDWRKHGHPDNE